MREPARHTVLRAVILYIAAFGITSLALGEAAYLYVRHELSRRLDARMITRMDQLQRAHARGGQASLLIMINYYADQGARTFGYVLTDSRGKRIRRVGDIPRLTPGWGLVGFEDRDEGRVDPARTLTRKFMDGATLTIVADRDFIEQYDAVTTGFLFTALALLFLVAAGGALSLERKVRSRVESLNNTARAIFEGDLEQRVPISAAQDEFDAIASTVNAMLDRLGWMLREVQRVTTYIAHDLREPLARLRDHLQRSSAATGGRTDIEAIEQCEDILRLFGAILRIGEISGQMIAKNATDFDLSALVSELTDAHVAVAEDSGRILDHDIAPGIRITGDRELLAQLLINLLDNALHHTPLGSHITVKLMRTGQRALLTVADNGSSLSEERRRQLTDQRGRRPGTSATRDGMGLKLAQAIAAGHHGRLALHDNYPGLRVEVALPLGLRGNNRSSHWRPEFRGVLQAQSGLASDPQHKLSHVSHDTTKC
jgi:hypothetical protein